MCTQTSAHAVCVQEALTPNQTMFIRYNDMVYYEAARIKQVIFTNEWVQSEKFFDIRQLRPKMNSVTTLKDFVWGFAKEEAGALIDTVKPRSQQSTLTYNSIAHFRVWLWRESCDGRVNTLEMCCADRNGTNRWKTIQSYDTKSGTEFRHYGTKEREAADYDDKHAQCVSKQGHCMMCGLHQEEEMKRPVNDAEEDGKHGAQAARKKKKMPKWYGGKPSYRCHGCQVYLCRKIHPHFKLSCHELWHSAGEGKLMELVLKVRKYTRYQYRFNDAAAPSPVKLLPHVTESRGTRMLAAAAGQKRNQSKQGGQSKSRRRTR